MLQNRHFKTIYIRSLDHSFRQCIPVSYGSREKAIHVIVWTSGHLSKRQRVLFSGNPQWSQQIVWQWSSYFVIEGFIKKTARLLIFLRVSRLSHPSCLIRLVILALYLSAISYKPSRSTLDSLNSSYVPFDVGIILVGSIPRNI